MVAWRSLIASRRPDWVLAGARLISSARRRSVKIGPLRRTNELLAKLNTLVPMMSDGIRSGVNWMRLNAHPTALDNALTVRVFAVPGTPSSMAWPPLRKAHRVRSSASSCPTTAFDISWRMAVKMLVSTPSSRSGQFFPILYCRFRSASSLSPSVFSYRLARMAICFSVASP